MPTKHSSEQAFESGRSPDSSNMPFRHMPPSITPLIGREHEVQEVCTLLRDPEVGLLTVTGPGGIGKTRLAFQVVEDVSAPARIKALFATAVLAGLLGNVDQATTKCQECLELCRGTGDSRNFVLTSWMLTRLATEQGKYVQAQEQAEEALEVATKAGDNLARAYAFHRLGCIALALGKYEQARKQLEECLVAFTEIGDLFASVEALRRLAEVFVAQGDETKAVALLDEGCLSRARCMTPGRWQGCSTSRGRWNCGEVMRQGHGLSWKKPRRFKRIWETTKVLPGLTHCSQGCHL